MGLEMNNLIPPGVPEEFDPLILENWMNWMNWMCQDGVTALELLFQHRVDSSGLNGGIDFDKARS